MPTSHFLGGTLFAVSTGIGVVGLLTASASPDPYSVALGVIAGAGIGIVALGWTRAQQAPPPAEVDAVLPASREQAPTDLGKEAASDEASLGVLAGGIAHDFNNLLTGILGNTSFALSELQPGPVAVAIQDAEVAARRARDLVAQLLAYSGRGRLELQAVDLRDLALEMVGLLARVVSPYARLTTDLPAKPVVVEGDPVQIRQVLMNLITNASDALGDAPGNIVVSVEADHLDADALLRTRLGHAIPVGPYARLSVRDEGCGMTAETAARMFEPFFTTRASGRGLGLAALLGTVRNHAGTLRVDSRVGEGTTVTVWFPTAAAGVLVLERSEPPRAATLGPTDHGTLLLAEDEELVRRVSTRMLSKLGFDVVAVNNGREALAVLAESHEVFSLAVIDVQMPSIDGRAVLARIRELRPDLPVVLMTGYTGREAEPTQEAPDAWLRKPFSIRDLSAALQEAREANPRIEPERSRSPS